MDLSTTTEVADATLVERAKDGDPSAFEVLVDRYQTAIFRLVVRIVIDRSEAEDIVQESMIAAWRRLDTLREADRFRPWIYQIASHQALDVVRSRSRYQTGSLDAEGALADQVTAPAGHGPERRAISSAQWQHLERAVEALPARQRACWVLKEFEGFSYAEIAQILQVGQDVVRGQLARARIALAEELRTWK